MSLDCGRKLEDQKDTKTDICFDYCFMDFTFDLYFVNIVDKNNQLMGFSKLTKKGCSAKARCTAKVSLFSFAQKFLFVLLALLQTSGQHLSENILIGQTQVNISIHFRGWMTLPHWLHVFELWRGPTQAWRDCSNYTKRLSIVAFLLFRSIFLRSLCIGTFFL